MKNGRWETLHLRDVKKGMLVACLEAGENPKGCKPHKITDVGFWIRGSITIKLDNDYMISIVDLTSRQRQLFQWMPLTVEEKLEKLIAAAEVVAYAFWTSKYPESLTLNIHDCSCVTELKTLLNELKEE